MTQAIIETLCRIRKQVPQRITVSKDNRYKLTVNDENCEETYYFSAPIVSSENGNIVSMKFLECGSGEYKLVGTNSNIIINSSEIVFSGTNIVKVRLGKTYVWNKIGNVLVSEDIKIVPTTNGITIYKKIIDSNNIELCVSSNNNKYETRANSKYFAIMKQRHVPSFIISAIGATNNNDDLWVKFAKAPAEYQYALARTVGIKGGVNENANCSCS